MKDEPHDFEKDWNELRQVLTPQSIIIFAEKIGVDPMALCMMDCHWHYELKGWAFPIRNENRNVTGIRIMQEHGPQWDVKYSTKGLYLPHDIQHSKSILCVQGLVKCVQLLSTGKSVVGFDFGCEEMAKEFLKINKIQNAMVLVNSNYTE